MINRVQIRLVFVYISFHHQHLYLFYHFLLVIMLLLTTFQHDFYVTEHVIWDGMIHETMTICLWHQNLIFFVGDCKAEKSHKEYN